jgi:hypothetical protein
MENKYARPQMWVNLRKQYDTKKSTDADAGNLHILHCTIEKKYIATLQLSHIFSYAN